MTNDQKLEAIVGGVSHDLHDLVDFAVAGHDGWGLPDVERITEQGPQQHGVTDKGFRLRPRIIVLKLRSLPGDFYGTYQLRARLLAIFKPTAEGIRLRRTLYGGDSGPDIVREAVVHTIDGLKYSTQNQKGFSQVDTVQLMAPDPALYDPAGEAFTLGNSGTSTGTDVPTGVPTTVGGSAFGGSYPYAYPGTWISYPVVRITGPITDPVVTNQTSGKKLDFTGYTIAAGDWYEVDTAYDRKTIVDSLGANQAGKLSSDSDLVNFAVLPDPEAPGGVNSFSVSGSAANSATRVDVSFLVRYVGM